MTPLEEYNACCTHLVSFYYMVGIVFALHIVHRLTVL